MDYYILVIFVGFAAGIGGTTLGSVISFFIRNRSSRFLSFILEFSAGLMIAVVCFDLLPEAFKLGGLELTIAGIMIGVIIIILFDNYIKTINQKFKRNKLYTTGILITISVALHNLPEGLAIGSSFDVSTSLGINLAFAISMHNIAEGLALAIPLKASKVKNEKIIMYSFLSGIPMGIGTLLGLLLGEVSNDFIVLCLGFAGGSMLYVVSGNLITESKSIYVGRMSTLGNILGIILGMIISLSG